MNTYSLGWIKLHRKLVQWEWYDDVNVRLLFFHCLLKSNYEDKNWKGQLIKRGSFITSIKNLSKEIGISEMKIRSAIKKLILTNEITIQTTNLNTMITVVCYDLYQSDNKQTNKPITNKQQTDNKRITTTKEVKNIRSKEVKNNTIVANSVIEYFNGVCVNLPKVIKATDKRKMLVTNRMKEYSKDDLKKVIDLTAESLFLNGDNNRGWTADFDWLMQKQNFIKILEGNYKNKTNGKTKRNITREQFEASIDKHFQD